MKKLFRSAFIFALSVTVIPAVPVYFSGNSANPISSAEKNESETKFCSDSYMVLDVSSGEILNVPVREYVIGSVCAEMPATFETEALKAQAVAAHTYAERQHYRETISPTPELMGADFSNDTSKYQGFLTAEQIKNSYGENYDEYFEKVSDAVDDVLSYIITYNGEPIISAFHSMSPGITESAENLWGSPVEYLVPVDSSYDTSAPRYLDEISFSEKKLRGLLEDSFGDISLGEDMKSWFEIGSVSDSGTVLEITVGGKKVTGTDIRNALGLRSACFEIRYDDDCTIFTTKGFGHGVGMSQYGADSMAAEGKTWREILGHYYPDSVIEQFGTN